MKLCRSYGSELESVAGYVLQDLMTFHIVDNTWENLTLRMRGALPYARAGHGFASCGGKLYVHGGTNSDMSGTPMNAELNIFLTTLVGI